jgi:hypothetical protein
MVGNQTDVAIFCQTLMADIQIAATLYFFLGKQRLYFSLVTNQTVHFTTECGLPQVWLVLNFRRGKL